MVIGVSLLRLKMAMLKLLITKIITDKESDYAYV